MASKSSARIIDWRGKELKAETRRAVSNGLRKALRRLRDEVRKDLSGPADSPEGGPPGMVTAQLRDAVKHKVSSDAKGITAVIGVLDDTEAMAYGARLGGGFAGRDRLGRLYSQAPRPWLEPAVERNAAQIVDDVASEGWGD